MASSCTLTQCILWINGYCSSSWFASDWPPQLLWNAISSIVPLTNQHVNQRSPYSRTMSYTKMFASHLKPPFLSELSCSEFIDSALNYNPPQHNNIWHSYSLFQHTHQPPQMHQTNQAGLPQPIYLGLSWTRIMLNSIKTYSWLHKLKTSQSSFPQDPLFIPQTVKVATGFWFHHHFCQVLLISGMSPDPYSGHSFHIF